MNKNKYIIIKRSYKQSAKRSGEESVFKRIKK